MKFVCDNTSIKLIVRHSLLDLTNGAKLKLIVGAQAVYAIILYKMKITKTFQKFNIHV